MSSWLVYAAVYLVAVMAVPNDRYCNGAVSRGIRRLLHRPKPSSYRRLIPQRILEVLTLWAIFDWWSSPLFWTLATLLFIDDFVNGNEDNWRRFREWARNKIKWKMELPKPVKVRPEGADE